MKFQFVIITMIGLELGCLFVLFLDFVDAELLSVLLFIRPFHVLLQFANVDSV